MIEVSEEMLVQADEFYRMEYPEDDTNIFQQFLQHGKKLKQMGVTPIYFYDDTLAQGMVVIEETYNKRLH